MACSMLQFAYMQPSRLYICEGKIAQVKQWFTPNDLTCFPPIPIKVLDEQLVMTDGHTRAVAALQSGLLEVPFVWETDELDWDMYRACVAACKEQGINQPGDLLRRVVNADTYRLQWEDWCDRMQADVRARRSLSLMPMTKKLCRAYYRGFVADPQIFMDLSRLKAFEYTDQWADAYFDRQVEKHRVHLAIMVRGAPIGEILLKDVNKETKECTLGIHLQNDQVKGRGFGTQAIRLALEHAVLVHGMQIVLADAVLKNLRSQHVLEKSGFIFQYQDDVFRYYKWVRQ